MFGEDGIDSLKSPQIKELNNAKNLRKDIFVSNFLFLFILFRNISSLNRG